MLYPLGQCAKLPEIYRAPTAESSMVNFADSVDLANLKNLSASSWHDED
jgi:hypothetical protein